MVSCTSMWVGHRVVGEKIFVVEGVEEWSRTAVRIRVGVEGVVWASLVAGIPRVANLGVVHEQKKPSWG